MSTLEEILDIVKGNISQVNTLDNNLENNLWGGVAEGGRNDAATRLAGRLIAKGVPPEEVLSILLAWNHLNQPPLTLPELETIIQSIDKAETRKQREHGRNLAHEIREWISRTNGDFNRTELDNELEIRTKPDKVNRQKILQRLCQEKVIQRKGNKCGQFRVIENLYEPIDHYGADDTPLELILPFDLHKNMEWFPRGMMVLAGDTDAGKTAILLNMAHVNRGKFKKIIYIATEMGGPLLKRRLRKLCDESGLSYPSAFEHVEFREPKTQNYMDLIDPDALNIIDYYELSDNFFLVSEYFRQVFENLDKGVAFIGLQKKIGATLGRAGDFAMEKPLLYITLNRGNIARIEKCKAERTNKFQPYAIEFAYRIRGGGYLTWERRLRTRSNGNCGNQPNL